MVEGLGSRVEGQGPVGFCLNSWTLSSNEGSGVVIFALGLKGLGGRVL